MRCCSGSQFVSVVMCSRHAAALRRAVEPHLRTQDPDQSITLLQPTPGSESAPSLLSATALRTALQELGESVEPHHPKPGAAPRSSSSGGIDAGAATRATVPPSAGRGRAKPDRPRPHASGAGSNAASHGPPAHPSQSAPRGRNARVHSGAAANVSILDALGLGDASDHRDSPLFGGEDDDAADAAPHGSLDEHLFGESSPESKGAQAAREVTARLPVGGSISTAPVRLEDSLDMADISGISVASSPQSQRRAPARRPVGDSAEFADPESAALVLNGPRSGRDEFASEMEAANNALSATDELIAAMRQSRMSADLDVLASPDQ